MASVAGRFPAATAGKSFSVTFLSCSASADSAPLEISATVLSPNLATISEPRVPVATPSSNWALNLASPVAAYAACAAICC